MVDTKEFMEGEYLTADVVRDSPSKKCVIVGEPTAKDTDYGRRLQAEIAIDQKTKKWNMNRDTIKNMQQVGSDSNSWNGAVVQLQVISTKGKDSVVGVPIVTTPEPGKEEVIQG